jgi:hypothetical protein
MAFRISALLFVSGLGAGLRLRARRRRRALLVRRRVVERPNSFYSAPGVRRLVDLERWGRIPVEQLHPLNRDEVRRLLRRVRADGPGALAPRERRFLDGLAPWPSAAHPPQPRGGVVHLGNSAW